MSRKQRPLSWYLETLESRESIESRGTHDLRQFRVSRDLTKHIEHHKKVKDFGVQ